MMLLKQRICRVCFLSLLLIACTDNKDLLSYIAQVKQRKTRQINSLPSMISLPSFTFPEKNNRRSPFELVSQRNELAMKASDDNRPKQPLEIYPLNQLKFVGVLKKDHEIWALIRLPNRNVTSARIGDYMGQQGGHIVLIKNSSMELIEMRQRSGKWKKHKIKIEI